MYHHIVELSLKMCPPNSDRGQLFTAHLQLSTRALGFPRLGFLIGAEDTELPDGHGEPTVVAEDGGWSRKLLAVGMRSFIPQILVSGLHNLVNSI